MENNIRTTDELKDSRFNYFIALRLSVTESDEKTIRQAMSRILGSTEGNLIHRRLIELKSDMEKTLILDPSLREKEARKASEFKIKEVMNVVKSMAMAKKIIYRSELEDITSKINKSVTYFTFEDLEAAFKEWNKIRLIRYVNNTTKLINFSKFESIHQLLSLTNVYFDLYEYIGVEYTASDDMIRIAKEKKYSEAMKLSDIKKKQLASSLCSDVDSVLLKPEMKNQYNIYIMLKDDIFDKWKLRKEIGAKELSVSEYQECVSFTMRRLSCSLKEAETILGEGIKYYQLFLSDGSADGSLALCPFCSSLVKSSDLYCPSCHKQLSVYCWNCNSRMNLAKDSFICPKCHADSQKYKEFNVVCNEFDYLFDKEDKNEAELKNSLLAIGSFGLPSIESLPTVVGKKLKSGQEEVDAFIEEKETKKKALKEEKKKAALKVKVQEELNQEEENYQLALNCIQSEDYKAAKKLLVDISQYKNSKELLSLCNHQVKMEKEYDCAKEWLEKGKTEKKVEFIDKAKEMFSSLLDEEYKDSLVLIAECEMEKEKVLVSLDTKKDDKKKKTVFYSLIGLSVLCVCLLITVIVLLILR